MRTGAPQFVRKALAEFGDTGPDPVREERQRQLEELASDLFDELDQAFYGYPEPLEELLVAYARSYRAAFGA